MDLTNDIIVTPAPIPVLPPALINNWSRKVEIETRYRTSVTKTNDAKEVRKGLRVRPSRFVAARLTALERSTISELTTVMLRLADQNTPIPLYSDVTEVEVSTDKGGVYFLGDFSHTRFFPNARLVHFGVYDGKAHGFTIYQMIGATAYYVEVVGPFIASLPGQQLVMPLLDIDIELESLQLRNHTAMVGEYDLNVNERMDESGLPPLIAKAPAVENPAFTEDFEEISVLDPLIWDSSGTTIVDGSLEISSFALLKSTAIPSVNDFRVVVTLSEGYTDEFLFRVQTDFVLDDSLDLRLVAGGQQVQARVVTGGVPVVITLDVVRPPTLLEIMRVNDTIFWYVDGVRVDLSEPPGFDTAVPIERILLDNTIGAGTIKIDSVTLYATATEYVQNVFNPQTFMDVPILDTPHNWKDSFNLDISRVGLRSPLGRGRIVTIDSERPQFEFHIQALMDRAELFDLLIFFEWARGRLAQFWFINRVTMWEVVSIIGNEITINKDTPDASDISSFFPYISLVNPDGTHEMAIVDTVEDQTTTLKITTLTLLSGAPFIYLTSAHLVRFSADSIREVWNSRDICNVSFKVVELLEGLQGVDLSIFGGFPNTNPADSIFGGGPDQCYEDEDKGYFGGNAVPPNVLVPVNVCEVIVSWDITTVVADGGESFSSGGVDSLTYGGRIHAGDGSKYYVLGRSNDRVYQWSLPTPWSLVGASYDSVSHYVGGQDSQPFGFFIRQDGGGRFWMVGRVSDGIFSYTPNTGWVIDPASYDGLFYASGSQPADVFWRPDGFKVWVHNGGNTRQFNVGTAWDVTSITGLDGLYNSNAQDSVMQGLYWHPQGIQFFLTGFNNDRVYQYDVTTPWDLTSGVTYWGQSPVLASAEPYGLDFRPDPGNLKMYIASRSDATVKRYSLQAKP